jgi:DNA-binding XRE family transcriptional regulator
MRNKVADWSAGALALIVLALGGLVVVKPAIDNWGDLYRSNPFEVRTTTQRVELKRAGEPSQTTVTRKQASGSFVERGLGNSGLLFLRLIFVALAAFLLAAVVQRAILGAYALRARPARAVAASAASEHVVEDSQEPNGTALPTRNGPSSSDEASAASLAPAIAKFIAYRREELGLSQRELAKRAGISHTVISRVESGEHSPSRKTLELLTEAFREDS